MPDQLERDKNISFFKENLSGWLADIAYKRKYVVIADQEVKAVHDSFPDALTFAAANLVRGEFIIQQVIGEDEQVDFLVLAS